MFGFWKKEKKLCLDAVFASETGLVRADNQDHVYVDPEARVFCVADGMGGGADGARASAIVCEHLRAAKLGAVLRPLADVTAAVDCAVSDAHVEIAAYAKDHGFEQMGSTAALVAFDGFDMREAAICHVGDSRVYRIRGGMAKPLTRDHTVGSALADFAGARARAFRSRSNPLAHVLTRAIGVTAESLKTEWRTVDVRAGDRFVICSDGVHDVITDARLAVYAGGGTLASARERLAQAVVANGAPDNYSFVIVEVGERD